MTRATETRLLIAGVLAAVAFGWWQYKKRQGGAPADIPGGIYAVAPGASAAASSGAPAIDEPITQGGIVTSGVYRDLIR